MLTSATPTRRSSDLRPVANAVAPGKRPRSSMSPMIVLDPAGRPVLVTGSPGGAHTINYVTKSIVAVLDWGLDSDHVVALPNIPNGIGHTVLEAGLENGIDPDLAVGLRRPGHETRYGNLSSGINMFRMLADGSLVGADEPRREGRS